jgi:phosphatidylglycerophosphate synthase
MKAPEHISFAQSSDHETRMLANWITLSRLPLLLITVLILYYGSPWVRLGGVGLLLLGLMLDTVDGVVARKRGETSLFGSVLDIAADRTYELVLWVCFADLRMIPLAIPLIIIARTTLTDAFRSIGVSQGTAPFAQHRTPLGRFLVGSTFMRTGYAITKVIAFCGLALAQALAGFSETVYARAVPTMMSVLRVTAWLAVAFCVFRGLPVIVHSLRQYWSIPAPARAEGS